MNLDSSLLNSCSATKTSSLAKTEDRGYASASAISRTSISCFRWRDHRNCPSAAGISLNSRNTTPAALRNGMREDFMNYRSGMAETWEQVGYSGHQQYWTEYLMIIVSQRMTSAASNGKK